MGLNSDQEDIPTQRRTNSDIYDLVEKLREDMDSVKSEAKITKLELRTDIKNVDRKIDDHLKFHEGVLIAAKELGEKRIKTMTLALMACTVILSTVGIIVGVIT